MAATRPTWLADLSRAFKRHRQGRPGWFLEEHRDRLRLRSDELPPRPGVTSQRQAITLTTPPGPATAAHALSEACAIFDGVMAGTWRWPEPGSAAGEDERLGRGGLTRLVRGLEQRLVGETIAARTWQRMYLPFLARLLETAGGQHWSEDAALLTATLRQWEPNSRARQMAHDRIRGLWKLAGWPWPQEVLSLRGNGKAAADPEGVRAFTDAEIATLRERIQASARLTPSDLLAWDLLACFGIRPAELLGLTLANGAGGAPLAVVTRQKRSSKGSSGARQIPAVPPDGWPANCFRLLERWKEHGLPAWSQTPTGPGQHMTQQLRRLHMPQELTAYGLRHAFALRLGVGLGLSVREAAELMGHSPAVHLATYGRRLDTPKLQAKVQQLVQQKILETAR